MRTLTITREKSFVASLATDLVYIEDAVESELTINGVPCRKLGALKNGKTVTFEIDHAQRQIFLIVDKLSKEYCNSVVTIPAGDEPVTLSGKHHFVLGSNPFRFNGVELTEEQKKQQQKNSTKGLLIISVAVVVGGLVGGLVGNLFAGYLLSSSAKDADPKTFAKGGMAITLTEAFAERTEPDFHLTYEAEDAMVMVIREDTEGLMITLEEYTEMVQEANDLTQQVVTSRDDYMWLEYTAESDGLNFYYLAACYCSEDDCWVITFATPIGKKDQYKEIFLTWADSVTFDSTI